MRGLSAPESWSQVIAARKSRIDELMTLGDSSKLIQLIGKGSLEAMQARLSSGRTALDLATEVLKHDLVA